jgi:hypothetical protein
MFPPSEPNQNLMVGTEDIEHLICSSQFLGKFFQ